ncbi:MAG: rod shape-determining protein MreC [Planctomycetota bacterium]
MSSFFSILLIRPNLTIPSSLEAIVTIDEKEELLALRLLTRKQQLEIHQLQENLQQMEAFKRAYSLPTEPLLLADVLHYDISPYHRSLYINKGKLEGIRKGSPVFKGEAFVGEIVEVGKHRSRVRLLHDSSSEVRIMLLSEKENAPSLDQGILKGDGTQLKIEWLPMDLKLQGEETVVTSMRSPWGKGLLIGKLKTSQTADQVLFQDLEVIPFVDLSQLEQVFVWVRKSVCLELFQQLEQYWNGLNEEDRVKRLEDCYLADLDEIEPETRLSPKQLLQLGDWFLSVQKKLRLEKCYKKAVERHALVAKEQKLSRSLLIATQQKLKQLEETPE